MSFHRRCRMLAILVLLVLVKCVATLQLFDPSLFGNAETVVPETITELNTEWRRHRRSVAVMPDHMMIRVRVGDDNLDLWVTRSEDNTVNMPVFHQTGEYYIEEDTKHFPQSNVEVYSNKTTQSVLLIQKLSKNVRMTGTFWHKAKEYRIQPKNVDLKRFDQIAFHSVWQHNSTTVPGQDEPVPCETHSSDRYKRAVPKIENTVELFYVIDSKAFSQYRSNFGGTHRELDKLVKLNVAYATESANVRFQSLNQQFPEALVRLCAVGVLVIKDPKQSVFTEGNQLPSDTDSSDSIDEEAAVEDFVTFIRKHRWHLPRADHFVAFTGYAFSTPELFAKEARVGSMCASDSASLIYDRQNGYNGLSIAHAIGHSLNALNDEVFNTTRCSGNFVMKEFQSEEVAPFNFSPCSAASINSFLPRLLCTKQVDVFGMKLEVGNITVPEFFNPEQICRNEFGNASDFCRILYGFSATGDNCFDAMCTVGIFCQLPFTGFCRSVPPYERISCGNKKWCVNSQCVHDENALATLGDELPAYNSMNFPCDRRFCSVYNIFTNVNCPLTCEGIFTCPV